MFLIRGQTAGLIRTKLGTWIHLDPGNVLVKVNIKVKLSRKSSGS